MIISLLIAIMGYISLGIGGITMGLLPLVTLLATYPFAAGNNGLDYLYATLGLTRRFVVTGRYFFALFMGILVMVIFFIIGMATATILGDAINVVDLVKILLMTFLITLLTIALNLPLLFKMGFKNAKSFATMFPLVLILVLMFAMHIFGDGLPNFIENLSQDIGGFAISNAVNPIIIAVIIIWILLMACSYKLSLFFYSRRDF